MFTIVNHGRKVIESLNIRAVSIFSVILAVLIAGCSKTQATYKVVSFRPFSSVFTAVNEINVPGIDPHNVLAFAIDSKSAIYVSDSAARNIRKFDHHGRLLNTIGGPGAAPGEFLVPWSMACDAQNNLYVLDIKTGRLSTFSEDGQFKESLVVSVFGFAGVAIKLNQKGDFYVGGLQPDKPESPMLYRISHSGQLEDSFFPRDARIEKLHLQLVGGVGLDLDESGRIYAVQPISPKVSVFASDGSLIKQFGSEPSFYRPAIEFPARLPSQSEEVDALLAKWTELYDVHVLQKEHMVLLSYAVHSPVAYGIQIYSTDGDFRIGEIGSSARPVLTSPEGHVYFYDRTAKRLVLQECSVKLPGGKEGL